MRRTTLTPTLSRQRERGMGKEQFLTIAMDEVRRTTLTPTLSRQRERGMRKEQLQAVARRSVFLVHDQ